MIFGCLKKLKVYGIRSKEDPNRYLTFCLHKKEVIEFLRRITVVDHFDHFQLWCQNRELDVKDPSAWEKYFEDCIQPEDIEKYQVATYKYNEAALVGILRIFSGCYPIGCSFDLDMEYEFMNQKLLTAAQCKKEIDEAIDKVKEQLSAQTSEAKDVNE